MAFPIFVDCRYQGCPMDVENASFHNWDTDPMNDKVTLGGCLGRRAASRDFMGDHKYLSIKVFLH